MCLETVVHYIPQLYSVKLLGVSSELGVADPVSEPESTAGIRLGPRDIEVLEKLLDIARKLDDMGFLDLISALLDPQVFDDILKHAPWDKINEVAETSDVALELNRAFLESLGRDSSIRRLRDLIALMRDEEFLRGLSRIIFVIKALGRISKT